MNTFAHARRTVFGLVLAALILAGGVFAFVSASSLKPTTPGHTGQVLALRTESHSDAASFKTLLAGPNFRKVTPKTWWPHLANGRLLQPNVLSPFLSGKHTHSARAMAAGINANPILITEGVQTFDVFAPPPSFVPPTATGPLAYINAQPVWTQDGSYIFFASNRPSTVASDPAGKYHIWAVAAVGGQIFQITSGPGNEFVPSLNANGNNVLAFISDANTPAGVDRYDLYILSQSLGTLPAPLGSGNAVPVNALDARTGSTLALNSSMTQGNTDFVSVGRPTVAPNGSAIAFAAQTSDPNPALQRTHIYFLTNSIPAFNPIGGGFPAQITGGNANDDNPAWSQDGNFIAFDSTAVAFTNTGASPSRTQPTVNSGNTVNTTHGVFLINANANVAPFGQIPSTLIGQVNGYPDGRITAPGADDITPAWSFPQTDAYFNQASQQQYLTFARGTAMNGAQTLHGVFYFQALITTSGTARPIAENNNNADADYNPSIQLNTSDQPNAGPADLTGRGLYANTFDNIYPAWAPFFKGIFNIVAQSPRSVTYNTPGTNVPTEVALNLVPGTDVPAGYTGLLESQVLNLDPPSMLRFSASEVIAVRQADSNGNITNTTPTRFIQPSVAGGQSNFVKFIARLSNRESGIDNVNGPNGGPNVYLQIKDPDSKYQDSQRLEHKLFANCNDVDLTTGLPLNKGTAATGLFNPGGAGSIVINNVRLFQTGAAGGFDTVTGGTLSVGHVVNGSGATDPTSVSRQNYRPWGPEYECQFVNPTRANPFNGVGDYGAPYYLAGIDDAKPFSGGVNPPRPIVDTTDLNTGVTTPAQYIQMQKLPDADQDGLGGVLYAATYQVPTAASDFYLDVIAYDNARFPFQTEIGPNVRARLSQGVLSTYDAQVKNWRIYDNVGGFTTQQFDGSNDILVVSDNALGQKFSFSTFSGSTSANLTPTLYGAESYYTDVDVTLMPNAVDTYNTTSAVYTQKFENQSPGQNILMTGYRNGLGVNSYIDNLINDGGTISEPLANTPEGNTALSYVRAQKYSLWRILSRGAVPASTLAGFQPTFVPQPAVNDTVNGVVSAANPNVPVATKCVIWVSPYTGDLPLVDAGSLENLTTQQTLQTYVNGGGRLCVTGQDVANSLGLSDPNSTNAFLTQTLGAAFRSNGGGSQILGGNNNRISGFSGGPITFNVYGGNFSTVSAPPSSGPLLLSNSFGGGNANYRADSSLDQTNGALRGSTAQIDTITPAAGTTTDVLTNGQAGLLYYQNYTTANGNFDGTRSPGFGSRIVFGSFGLEGVSQDAYRFSDTAGNPHFVEHNYRTKLLHNIVNYFRTGTFSGTITATTPTGVVAVAGATVYFTPTGGIPNPRPRQIFSGTTGSSGNYLINGIEPGTYFVTAYAPGFTTVRSNGTFSLEGDTTVNNVSLVLNQQPSGRIAGTVKDPTGKPLGGAKITFKSTDGQITLGPATSAADGTYAIDNAPVNSYNGTATLAPRYGAAAPTQGNPVTVVSGQTAPADFVLTPNPATVTGTVFNDLNASGLPRDPGEPGLAGATVTFTSADGQTTFGPFTTDANGGYTATVTTPGTYTVTAKLATYEQRTVVTIVLDYGDVKTQDVPLVFVPPGSITGHVTNFVTGAPVSGATVTFVSTDGSLTVGPVVTDGNGNYAIPNVPRGQYNGTASHQPDYVDALAPVQGNPISVPSGAGVGADFKLVPKGSLSGRVTDAVTGAPLPNAAVTFVSTDGTQTYGPVTTDANGGYAIPNVVPTTYIGTATFPPNYVDAAAPVQGNPVTVPNGAGAQADFRLTPKPAAVSGFVYLDPNDNATLDNGEVGLAGATVVFTPTQFGSPATATSVTTPLGGYTASLVEGTYTVTATKPGYRDLHPFTITVGPNGTATNVNVPLIVPPGTLGGLVTDAFTGQPLGGATITIKDANGNTVTPLPNSGSLTTAGTSTTGPDGAPINYGPVRLPPGTYTVTLTPPSGYIAATQSATVTSDGFARVDFSGATGVQPLHVFPAGLNFFSVPYDYASAGVTADTLFGQLNTGTFLTNPPVYNPPTANRSHLFVYRPELLQYVVDPTPPADGLHLGQGYWVYLRNGREVNFAIPPPATGVIAVGLRRGWNMIGVPSVAAINLSRVTFANPAGTGPITFDQAASNTYRIVSPTLYGYNQGSNAYFPVTSGAALQPWQAYWIYAYVDATVQIPTTGG